MERTSRALLLASILAPWLVTGCGSERSESSDGARLAAVELPLSFVDPTSCEADTDLCTISLKNATRAPVNCSLVKLKFNVQGGNNARGAVNNDYPASFVLAPGETHEILIDLSQNTAFVGLRAAWGGATATGVDTTSLTGSCTSGSVTGPTPTGPTPGPGGTTVTPPPVTPPPVTPPPVTPPPASGSSSGRWTDPNNPSRTMRYCTSSASDADTNGVTDGFGWEYDPDLGRNGSCKVREVCTNSHQSCQSWAARGECSANPRYMLVNCCAACSQQPTPPRPTPPPVTPPRPTPPPVTPPPAQRATVDIHVPRVDPRDGQSWDWGFTPSPDLALCARANGGMTCFPSASDLWQITVAACDESESCSFQGVPLSGGEVDLVIIDVDPGRTNEVIAEGRCRMGQTCTFGSGAARVTVRL
jgi:hypothetical protein